MELPKIIKFCGYPKVKNIVVIGCGGTGAYVVSHLTRFLSVSENKDVKLFLADGDDVEDKNLKRQHFVKQDIAKNKATVLAERYSNIFGIEIYSIPKDIEKKEDFEFLNRKQESFSDLIIACVDNNASRKFLYNYFTNNNKSISRFWLDCGNEEKAGQVICGYFPSEDFSIGSFSLPCVIEHYPDVLNSNSKFNSSLSCAERAVSAPQNIQTNITAATIALNYINKILSNLILTSHGVEFSIDNYFTTKLNVVENLNKVNKERKRNWEK